MASHRTAQPHPASTGQRLLGPSPAGVGRSGRARTRPALYERFLKHKLDRLLAPVLFVLFSPLMALIALAVRAALGPDVIYRQRRVGRNGKPFTIFKFRTMTPGPVAPLGIAGPDRWSEYQSTADPRHTRLGRLLRRSSLDELPQLINVIKGEMSLVGPRPELVEIVEDFNLWEHPRHAVRPGITGSWQISPDRSARLHDCVDMDLEYVADVSLRRDIRIVARTVGALLLRTGR